MSQIISQWWPWLQEDSQDKLNCQSMASFLQTTKIATNCQFLYSLLMNVERKKTALRNKTEAPVDYGTTLHDHGRQDFSPKIGKANIA